MVSGSRAPLTFILSDHPQRPSRHFDGALTSRVSFHPPTSICHWPIHQCSPASVVRVSTSGPWKSGRLNQCATTRLSGTSALPTTAPLDHPSWLLRHTPVTGASPSGRRSTSVTGSPAPASTRSSILQMTSGSGLQDNSITPGASSGASPPTSPSCSAIGCPGSLKGYTGRSGRTACLVGGSCVLMAPS
jgi:hypothetical protein